MYIQNVSSADIFIGTAAGRKVRDDIWNAKSSIKICTPFIDEKHVSLLMNKRRNGVDVSLVTMEKSSYQKTNDFYKGNYIYDPFGIKSWIESGILLQNFTLNNENIQLKNENISKAGKRYAIFAFSIIAFILITMISFFVYISTLDAIPSISSITIFLGVWASIIIGHCLYLSYQKKIIAHFSKLPLRYFFYTPQFNFKIVPLSTNSIYNHLKLYVIDDSVAYLGSFNFNSKGMNSNIESAIRVKDKETVIKLSAEFDKMYQQSPYIGYDEIGRSYFHEDYFSV